MNIMRRMARAAERYGRSVTLHTSSGDYVIKAFLNPFRSKNRFYLESEGTRIGRIDKGHMSFAAVAKGPALLLCEGNFVTAATERYFVKRCESHYMGDEPFYVWAVLVRTEKEHGA